jgi:hypothetical protein
MVIVQMQMTEIYSIMCDPNLIRGLVYLAIIQSLISYRQEKGKGM